MVNSFLIPNFLCLIDLSDFVIKPGSKIMQVYQKIVFEKSRLNLKKILILCLIYNLLLNTFQKIVSYVNVHDEHRILLAIKV